MGPRRARSFEADDRDSASWSAAAVLRNPGQLHPAAADGAARRGRIPCAIGST